jgi:uncharacterized protein (DUF1810 family)
MKIQDSFVIRVIPLVTHASGSLSVRDHVHFNYAYMNRDKTLQRFLDAQQMSYEQALTEIQHGKKRTHWMWFIFPQILGLGFSETSKFYAIRNRQEAEDYIKHPVLGKRLVTICRALLDLSDNDANRVFGSPDDLKLQSSMTLFSSLKNTDPVFQFVLDKFFNGLKDKRTLEILEEEKKEG